MKEVRQVLQSGELESHLPLKSKCSFPNVTCEAAEEELGSRKAFFKHASWLRKLGKLAIECSSVSRFLSAKPVLRP